MKTAIKNIPTISSDHFQLGNSYKMTGVYFGARIIDGVLDTKYVNNWTPFGLSRESRLLSQNSTVAIMFENEFGEKTWFHFEEEEDY